MTSRILIAALLLASASIGTSRKLENSGTPASVNVVVAPQSDKLTALNKQAMATGGKLPGVPPSSCANAKSPVMSDINSNSGTKFSAQLSGTNNIKPNTTGIATPMPGPSKGTYTLIVDESGKKASWTLELCDVPQYVASHLHIGSAKADYPPPLIPLEPYVKPADPFAPPNVLPQFCPPKDIKGCSYKSQGSFKESDIVPLAGRAPRGDKEVPSVSSFADFVNALKAGKIYINIHSKEAPANLIRGNLYSEGSGMGGSSSPTATESGNKAGGASGTSGSMSGSGMGTSGMGAAGPAASGTMSGSGMGTSSSGPDATKGGMGGSMSSGTTAQPGMASSGTTGTMSGSGMGASGSMGGSSTPGSTGMGGSVQPSMASSVP